ncbi:MAG TPA: YoaK family protein [Nevskiaceae bacterium]|nr:YoaK family protein [Nevskiaceae bacterium]
MKLTIALVILSFTAGTADEIAFTSLGDVFTSAMSGNTVILGLAIGLGHMDELIHAGVAVLGYVSGVAIASIWLPERTPIIRMVALEAFLLLCFAIVWVAAGGPSSSAVVYALIVLSAVPMGIQGAIGRTVGISGLLTVVFTSTYTAIVGEVVRCVRTKERPAWSVVSRQRVSALFAYLSGAVICGVIVSRWRMVAPLIPVVAISGLLVCLYFDKLYLGKLAQPVESTRRGSDVRVADRN